MYTPVPGAEWGLTQTAFVLGLALLFAGTVFNIHRERVAAAGRPGDTGPSVQA